MENAKNSLDKLKQNIVDSLKSHGIEGEVTSVDLVLPPELRGEHFATETAYATVNFKESSIPPKNLFVKKFSSNAVHTELIQKMKLMEKESAFFNNLLPALRKFCAQFPGCEILLDFFPKCFYADDYFVVLENLVLDRGYVMLEKEDQQDYITAKIVFQNLAKYHAASYAFIENMGRENFENEFALNITESFHCGEESEMAPMFEHGIVTSIRILTDNPVSGSLETIEKLGALVGKVMAEFAKILVRDEKQFLLVMNHGDCWNNNLLFKKNSNGNILDHKFVDLQVTRYGSPCLDLGYYFFTSVKPEVRISHFEDLLKLYCEQFTATVEMLGSNVSIFFEDLVKDFKRCSKLGYLVKLSMAAGFGAFKEIDLENMSDMGSNPEEMMAKFNAIVADWISANPDKANEISTTLVNFVQEFEDFQKN